MKKLLLTTIATVGFAAGVFAQGAILLDNSQSAGGPCDGTAGNYYGGAYGLQVWYLSGTTIPSGINTAGATDAYTALTSQGFTLAKTFTGQNNASNPGVIAGLGEVDMAGINPKGNAVIALAMWEGSGLTYLGAQRAGVLAFVNATSDYTASPAPQTPILTGFATDLVMTAVTPIPEPGTFALAGLGAAAMLIFRRRK